VRSFLFSVIFFFIGLPLTTRAQFTYVQDQSIPVKDQNGDLLPMPWAGGVNAAQHNTLDLNGDSKMDLVLFDRMANKVMTYLNKNNQYVYAPDYESLFPDDVTNWVLLRDYNCDGKKDLFTGDILGMKVYLNVTEGTQNLSWQKYSFYVGPGLPKSSVLLTKGFSGLINLQLQYDDLPSITDVDGDGDLDIMCMRFVGNGTAEFHQNFSKERYGTCDSLVFERMTQIWGGFTECFCDRFAFDTTSCPPQTGGRIAHAGGKSILALDVDGDNDLDLLFSEATCTNVELLRNQGTTASPIIRTHEGFPASKPINFYIYPAIYYEDVDFDGVSDLIATPNIYARAYFNTDLSASNWLYKNTGTQQSPSFMFVKTNFLQDKMIDVGDNSVPAFADYDGDGDQDMFISYYSSLTTYGSAIVLYENTGDVDNPAFTFKTADYASFSTRGFFNAKIQFADINGDNKIDLFFSATDFAKNSTKLYYIPNQNDARFEFTDQPAIDLNMTLSADENAYAYDMNFDGRQDLFIGRSNGAIEYWENQGSLTFSLTNPAFLGIASSLTRQNPSCSIADLDGDGKKDFLYTDQTGRLKIVSDVRNAKNVSEQISDIIHNVLLNRNESNYFGSRVRTATVNLFSRNRPSIVVGNILGGLQFLRNDDSDSLSDVPVADLYPIPVLQSNTLQIMLSTKGTVQLFSSLGQQLSERTVLQGNQVYTFKMATFAPGVYIARFTFNTKTFSKRFVVY